MTIAANYSIVTPRFALLREAINRFKGRAWPNLHLPNSTGCWPDTTVSAKMRGPRTATVGRRWEKDKVLASWLLPARTVG